MESRSQQSASASADPSTESVAPRRGSRIRQPTRKAEQLASQVANGLSRAPTEKDAETGSHFDPDSNEVDGETSLDGVDQQQRQQSDEPPSNNEDSGPYCLCRGGDNGSPMVYCGGCDEWYHFTCVQLTEEVAMNLADYSCPECSAKTGKLSKVIAGTDGSTVDIALGAKEGAPSAPQSPTSQSPAGTKRKISAAQGSPREKKRRPISPPSALSRGTAASKTAAKTSSNNSSTVSQGPQTDAVRSRVVARFVDALTPIFTKARGPDESIDCKGLAEGFAEELEKGVFEAFADSVAGRSGRVAQKAYKDRFRTLDFNLRDKGNDDLHARIANGSLSAASLATLHSDELANASIRAMTEKARQDSLQQSILREQQSAPLRKMTHKGEVDIEHDSAAPMHDHFASVRPSAASTDKDGRGRGNADASADTNVVESGQSAPGAEKLPTLPSSKRTAIGPDAGEGSPTATGFDFSNVWAAAPEKADREPSETAGSAEGEAENDILAEEAAEEYEPAKASDDLIDNFLQGISTPQLGEDLTDPSEQDAARSTTPASTPPPYAPILWRGAIHMPEFTSISGMVRQVAGPQSYATKDTAATLFPALSSIVQGRLPSQTASDYLMQSHVAPRTELVVFTFEKVFELDALKTTPQPTPLTMADHDASFGQFLTFLQQRQRYAVLAPAPFARGKIVKDFYIAPLPKDAPMPPWLQGLGPRWTFLNEGQRDRDMLLLVAVVFKGTLGTSHDQSSYYGVPAASNAAARQDSAARGTPPVPSDVGNLINGGSTALQDLLKAVGGGGAAEQTPSDAGNPALAGPHRPAADPRARGQPSFSATPQPCDSPSQTTEKAAGVAALLAGGQGSVEPGNDGAAVTRGSEPMSETAAAATALSQLPQTDIQSALVGNPNLLSSLLQTLGGNVPAQDATGHGNHTEAQSPGLPPGLPGVDPPGPPPPPPPYAAGGPPPGPPPARPPYLPHMDQAQSAAAYPASTFQGQASGTISAPYISEGPAAERYPPSGARVRGGGFRGPPVRGGSFGRTGGPADPRLMRGGGPTGANGWAR